MSTRSKKKRFAGILVVATLLSLCLYSLGWALDESGSARGIHIQVKENVVVKGPDVLLGEIAQIDAPQFLKDGLIVLEVGPSPKPGRMKQIQGKRIHSLILAHDLVDEEMRIEVPKRVFIKRGSQKLEESLLKEELGRYLSGFLGNQEYKLKAFRVRGLEPYPDGELELVLDKPGTLGSKGKFSLHVNVLVDGIKQDRVNIKGRVAVYKSIAYAARSLKKGEAPTSADVQFQTMDIFEIKDDYLENLGDVNQMALTVNIDKGDCLRRGIFKKTPVVKKGDVIKLVARKNRLAIVTLGICRQDGYENQPVMVENLNSGKLVRGLVKKNATVEVLF